MIDEDFARVRVLARPPGLRLASPSLLSESIIRWAASHQSAPNARPSGKGRKEVRSTQLDQMVGNHIHRASQPVHRKIARSTELDLMCATGTVGGVPHQVAGRRPGRAG